MLEEAYEFLSSVRILEETGSADNMCEELGDLLLQIVMHAEIADEEGLFTMEDVVNEISRKMVRRHPHVFGTTEVSGVSDVLNNWDDIKKKEKEGKTWIESPLREIPKEQPALTRASKVLKKVHKGSEPVLDYDASLDKLSASIEALKQQGKDIPQEELEKELGKMLMELSAIAAENHGLRLHYSPPDSLPSSSRWLPPVSFDIVHPSVIIPRRDWREIHTPPKRLRS